jgi:hypothetical protein
MLLGIWLVLCSEVRNPNPPRLGELVYTNGFTRDAIHECGEASLGFPMMFSLEKKVKWFSPFPCGSPVIFCISESVPFTAHREIIMLKKSVTSA